MKLSYALLLQFLFISLFFSCTETDTIPQPTLSGVNSEEIKLFELVPPTQSGISFSNQIKEDLSVNFFNYDAVYQGAGVAVGDINNDGLQDIFFAGNMEQDKLYLNKGDFKFEDITQKAKIQKAKEWSTGVYMVDVNGDGWLDIYICRFLFDDWTLRKNKLYINNKDLTFTENGEKYGIADAGFSTSANFFDMDNDGDLDLYVANQPPNSTAGKKALKGKRDTRYTDNLYRNNGNETFTNITKEAGITNYSFSLSVTAGDLDNDGLIDLYVASDYSEPDYFYRNNGNGTFTNIADQALRHMSNFSMGADIADMNNDGWLDLYTADMVAADNVRLKTNMSGMNPELFWTLANAGYHYQYMFNSLQLNNGNGTFSEIAQLSGVSNTDWSWTSVFADLDNDGYKDLMVTNGILRDMRNNDFNTRMRKYIAEQQQLGKTEFNPDELLDMAPSIKLHNYIYKNNGDLTFKDMVKNWGFEQKNWAQGAAYADFDNDGDIDLVTNCMNDPAALYRNTATENRIGNYLRIKLAGEGANQNGFGTRIKLFIGSQTQIQEVTPIRGFMSCSENVAHFGIGNLTTIDRVEISWPNGQQQVLNDVKSNQLLTVYQKDAVGKNNYVSTTPLLIESAAQKGLDFKHKENVFDDFKREILLPYELSHLGPCLAKTDVNGDQLEDFYVGGAAGQTGQLYLQQAGGNFVKADQQPWSADQASEDVGVLFFDANGDGNPDLYVASGGNEFEPGSSALQDRLYINNGKGSFSKSASSLPKMNISSSKAAAADYDGDGDQDLFVGGRQVPGKYGTIPRSFVLKNENGKFIDVTTEVAPDLFEPGMVTDAMWTDIDGDKDLDLMVVGEWMPISFYKNENGKLTNNTEEMGMANTSGWWNCLTSADYDGDGDQDFIAGNLGLNIKYKASVDQPFKVYVKDFDENGSNDVYLGYYDQDGICYPVRGRECSSQQLPFIKQEFKSYDDFAHASIEQVLGPRVEGAVSHEAKIFESVYIENRNGTFVIKPLPNEAQISPIFGAASFDWNKDGHLDFMVVGNYYQREVETTRSDAGIGQILLGDGKGNFKAMHPTETGLKAYKDVRAVSLIFDDKKQPMIIIANNDDQLELYQLVNPEI
jgi:enediyne biosynthesis protein E4